MHLFTIYTATPNAASASNSKINMISNPITMYNHCCLLPSSEDITILTITSMVPYYVHVTCLQVGELLLVGILVAITVQIKINANV